MPSRPLPGSTDTEGVPPPARVRRVTRSPVMRVTVLAASFPVPACCWADVAAGPAASATGPDTATATVTTPATAGRIPHLAELGSNAYSFGVRLRARI
ncbi:hypothetical protein QF037_000557 [Streptomyces canus]|nr:hypothetical protein [Streptomyces canus]